MKLNPAQRKAVTHEGSPALVLAGAGSGKTGVITRRIAWLIDERAVDPAGIVAVTFTNKAAREMKARVTALAGARAEGAGISTFHRLGMRILRREHGRAGLTPSFSIVGPADSRAIIADLLAREFGTDPSAADAVAGALSAWRNAPRGAPEPPGSSLGRIDAAYRRHLRALNALDLDDMVCLPRDLLAEDEELLGRWRERIGHLLVDEYQDTNAAQYELVRLLAGDGSNLVVVGDDDQSIYAWRGAMPENLARLAQDFPDLEVIKLEQNYRSRGRILKLANHLIRNNRRTFEKTLWSELGPGDPVRVLVCANEMREADQVVSELMSAHFQRRARYGDFAILYRSNHQSRIFEQRLMQMRVPYQLSGGQSFFDRTEVRDLMAYLRLIANPADDSALMRIVNAPRRGIGAGTLEKLGEAARARRMTAAEAMLESAVVDALPPRARASVEAFAGLIVRFRDFAESAPPGELIDDLLEEIGYRQWLLDESDSDEAAERRWQNVQELRQWLERVSRSGDGDGGLADAVRTLVLTDMLDRREDDEVDDDKVRLMTLHAAKGLEFDHVILVGVSDDLLPHANSTGEAGVEEERRLFYVGITRARKHLTLSWPSSRRRYGEIIDCRPSRFIDELPAEDLEFERDGEADDERVRNAGRAHLASIRALLAR